MTSLPGRTTKGFSIERLRRVDEIEEALLSEDPPAVVDLIKSIMQKHDISRRQAYRDLAEAQLQLARVRSKNREELFAHADWNWRRREAKADAAGDHKAGNAAAAEWCKLHGLNAPKKVEMSGEVKIGVHVDVHAIIGILDEKGLAAWQLVREQIEAARADGRLPVLAAPKPDEEQDE